MLAAKGFSTRPPEARQKKAIEHKAQGISQRQSAKLLGVSHTTIERDLAQNVPDNGTKGATPDQPKAAAPPAPRTNRSLDRLRCCYVGKAVWLLIVILLAFAVTLIATLLVASLLMHVVVL
jgi:transposase